MKRTGAQILIECLESENVECIFGIVGSAVLDIADAIALSGKIRFIPHQHEQGAAYAADGYSRVSGKPGVVLTTVGPGAANMITGICQAYHESMPVIAISGETANSIRGKGRSNWHEINQVEMFRPVTKMSERIESVDRIPEIMQKAFRVAISGRPGPVYICLPKDVQSALSDVAVPDPLRHRPKRRPRPASGDVREVVDLLLASKNPFILAGGGVLLSGAREEVVLMAERLAVPVAATAHHRGIFPDNHPLGLGQIGIAVVPYAREILREADLVMGLGCTFSEFTTDRYSYRLIPEKSKIIQIDIDPEEIGKNYPVSLGVVGDLKSAVRDIMEELDRRGYGEKDLAQDPRVKRIKVLKDQWHDQMEEFAGDPQRNPVNRAQVMLEVRKAIPDDCLVLSEAGGTVSYSRFAFQCYEHLIVPGDFSAMGSGFCLGLGVKTARPDKKVLTISGDGSMMMVLPELFTAVENKIAITAVIMHNNTYSNIKHKQQVLYGDRYIGADHNYPSFSGLARLMGAYGESVRTAAELGPAIVRALDHDGPAVVEVDLDPQDMAPPSKTYLKWVNDRQMK